MIARSELRTFYEAVEMCSHIQILFLAKHSWDSLQVSRMPRREFPTIAVYAIEIQLILAFLVSGIAVRDALPISIRSTRITIWWRFIRRMIIFEAKTNTRNTIRTSDVTVSLLLPPSLHFQANALIRTPNTDCDQRVLGVRYKCAHPDCPDFDLCENCEANPENDHPESHPLMKFKVGWRCKRSSSGDWD
jgi:hypothetical protein